MTKKTPRNQNNKHPASFCLHFTENERKPLELATGDRSLGAYTRSVMNLGVKFVFYFFPGAAKRR